MTIPLKEEEGILWLLFESGEGVGPTYRCKIHSTVKE